MKHHRVVAYLIGAILFANSGLSVLAAETQLVGKWVGVAREVTAIYELELTADGAGRLTSVSTSLNPSVTTLHEIVGWKLHGKSIALPNRVVRGYPVKLSAVDLDYRRLQLTLDYSWKSYDMVLVPKEQFSNASQLLDAFPQTSIYDLDPTCFRPLADYCLGDRCPTWQESVEKTKNRGRTESCTVASVGTCADLKVTRSSGGFGSRTEYFKPDGTLIAATTTSDSIAVGTACPNWSHFGERPVCMIQKTEDYCRQ
ncbi:MAG: hypothetical protein V4484_19915 [Pseudomonadota bacterium]